MTRSRSRKKDNSSSSQKDLDNGNNENKIDKIDILYKIEGEKMLDSNLKDLYEKILKTKDDLLEAKDIIITELNCKILLLQEKITLSINSRQCGNNSSYAEAAQNCGNINKSLQNDNLITNEVKKKVNTIKIKPSKVQDNKITRKDVSNCINPAKLKVNITKIQDIREGGIKIECNSEEELEIIRGASKSLGKNYLVDIEKRKKPRIKIVGIEDEMNEAELRNSIIEKNYFVDNIDIKLVVMKKMKKKFMAILEVDSLNFKNIMEKGLIFIDFAVCTVYEHVDIMRCYNCAGYYHSAKYCTKLQVCMKCGNSGHIANSCSTTNKGNIICPNCNEANEKQNLGYYINHSPFDLGCQIYKLNLEKAKKRVDYDNLQ